MWGGAAGKQPRAGSCSTVRLAVMGSPTVPGGSVWGGIPGAEQLSCPRLMEVGLITAVPGGSQRDDHGSSRRIPKG